MNLLAHRPLLPQRTNQFNQPLYELRLESLIQSKRRLLTEKKNSESDANLTGPKTKAQQIMRRDHIFRGSQSYEKLNRKVFNQSRESSAKLLIENGIKYENLVARESQNNSQRAISKTVYESRDPLPDPHHSRKQLLLKKIQLISSNTDQNKSGDFNPLLMTNRIETSLIESPFKPYNEKQIAWMTNKQ